jgi:hypothetical protein
LEGGINLYPYVGNNPIGNIDPLGLQYKEQYAAGGVLLGSSIVAAGSIVVDVATGGLNILATPAEIAAGAALGGAIGWGVGSILDYIFLKEGKDAADACEVDKNQPPSHPDFVPDKRKHGLRKIPWDKNKKGYPDKRGDYWEPVPDGHKGTHDPHWDVQHPDGTHTPKYPVK